MTTVRTHTKIANVKTPPPHYNTTTPTKVQLRRLKVAEVWDKGCANLSYTKLLSAAARFVVNNGNGNNNNNNKNNVLAKAVASYRDEDGDQVTFSSNDEFKDAFLQVLATYPERKPFLVTITLPIDGEGSELPSGDWYVRARG